MTSIVHILINGNCGPKYELSPECPKGDNNRVFPLNKGLTNLNLESTFEKNNQVTKMDSAISI